MDHYMFDVRELFFYPVMKSVCYIVRFLQSHISIGADLGIDIDLLAELSCSQHIQADRIIQFLRGVSNKSLQLVF